MLFSYNWLQSLFNQKLPKPEKLAELLTMHSFEVKNLEEIRNSKFEIRNKTQIPNSKFQTKRDWVFDIDILPNRGHDCLCHFGLAREISAIFKGKLALPKREKLKSKNGNLKPIALKIKCPLLVPRYSALVLEAVEISQYPQWLKKRLETLGIRSINNIVDLTNFLMLEIGQPLHAFDYDKILGRKMLLRQSKKGEKIITLDDIERTLPADILVIEDKNRLIDLVGIMGGKLSEIDSKTKNIVLQAGNFDRKTLYQTAKNLKHSTAASNIYIHGIDPNLTIPALERAYFLFKQVVGGKIVQIIDFYPQKACPVGPAAAESFGVLPKKIKLDLDYVERLLGAKIPRTEIKRILERLGLKIENWKLKIITVVVPTFRLDISLPEDLIEEIGRLYGYQKIKSIFPLSSLIPPKRNFELFWEEMIKDILKEAGFSEVYNYSFISNDDSKIFEEVNLIEVENPVSAEQRYLRPSLIPALLKNVQKNQKYFQEIKIFELGKTFRKCQMSNVKCQMSEKRMLTATMTGEKFYEAKGIIDLLLEKLGISNIWYDEYQPTPEESKLSIWHQKRCAEIKIDQEEIGFLGEISPKILDAFKIQGKAVFFDIDFEKLQKLASEEHEYQPISIYPAAIRDIAILVPRFVKVEDVLNKIETGGGKLIRDVDLFDIYEGEEIPEGKKNLAFHIIYQAEDRTLSSVEIDEVQQKIIEALEENPDWEVRR